MLAHLKTPNRGKTVANYFAVAAVAFVVKYDSNFAAEFLIRVAGVPERDVNHRFEIKPQADHCADLLIDDASNGHRYVIEFKVHAPIEDKQSPNESAFRKTHGYCSQIIQRFGRKTKIYTVLSKHREFDDGIKRGILYRARTWQELIPKGGTESPKRQPCTRCNPNLRIASDDLGRIPSLCA